MKIVGFESESGLRLGVVEGDQVIDLQSVDSNLPANLGDVLAKTEGDLKPLADLAKRAPGSARRPFSGLKFALPVARPGKIVCLGSTISIMSRKAATPATCRNFPPSSFAV